MQIACVSTWHGRGSTSNCIAVANNLALNYNTRILLTQSQYIRSNLEDAYINERENENILDFNDIGIDSLERILRAGQLNVNDLYNYCLTEIPGRLDILTGSKKNKQLFSNIIGKNILDILQYANKAYDIVIVDVNSGINFSEDDVSKKVLESSDLIIVTLDQTEKVLESFFRNDINDFRDKNISIVLGRYDIKSKCSKKYVRKSFEYGGEIYCIPYLTEYMDAMNNHSVLKFFYGNRKFIKKDSISTFFNELDLLTNGIVDMCNLNLSTSKVTSKDLFSAIKQIFKVG